MAHRQRPDGRPRRRRLAGASGGALAGRLLVLGSWGIGLRALDRCAGGVRPQDLEVCGDRIAVRTRGSVIVPSGARADRAETHGRRGHDAGCAALGLPLGLAERLLLRWDGAGAHRYLTEALRDAVADICTEAQGRLGGWSAAYASEALVFAVERRFEPFGVS